MRPVRRVVLSTLLLLVAGSVRAEETARCPGCEHRWVLDVHGTRTRGTTKEPCRTCRARHARFNVGLLALRHEQAATAEAREEIEAEWQAIRDDLRSFGYAVGSLRDERPPRLLPLQSPEALSLALFDEAQRLRRSATWSRDMASELKRARGTWRRAVRAEGSDTTRADWVWRDRIRAWEERATLHQAVADRYRAQARDLSTDALEGVLPPLTDEDGPEGSFEPRSVAAMVDGLRTALRELLAREREALAGLLAWTRRQKTTRVPARAQLDRMRELRGDAFGTPVLVNVNRRRVAEIDLLRSNVLTDADLEPFFERAPVLAEALTRLRARAPEGEEAPER